jgi:hypothetical protein
MPIHILGLSQNISDGHRMRSMRTRVNVKHSLMSRSMVASYMYISDRSICLVLILPFLIDCNTITALLNSKIICIGFSCHLVHTTACLHAMLLLVWKISGIWLFYFQLVKLFISLLLHILNLSCLEGNMPCKIKIARVVLLFKKGFREKFVTTHPVLSCLSVFKKIWRK